MQTTKCTNSRASKVGSALLYLLKTWTHSPRYFMCIKHECSPCCYGSYRGTGGKILKPSITTQSKYSILRHFSYILMSCIDICTCTCSQNIYLLDENWNIVTMSKWPLQCLNDHFLHTYTVQHKLYSPICVCVTLHTVNTEIFDVALFSSVGQVTKLYPRKVLRDKIRWPIFLNQLRRIWPLGKAGFHTGGALGFPWDFPPPQQTFPPNILTIMQLQNKVYWQLKDQTQSY